MLGVVGNTRTSSKTSAITVGPPAARWIVGGIHCLGAAGVLFAAFFCTSGVGHFVLDSMPLVWTSAAGGAAGLGFAFAKSCPSGREDCFERVPGRFAGGAVVRTKGNSAGLYTAGALGWIAPFFGD